MGAPGGAVPPAAFPGADPAGIRSMPGNEHHDRCRLEAHAQDAQLVGRASTTELAPCTRRCRQSGTRPRLFAQAGKPSPFRAPQNAHACPRVPVRSRANFLPLFAVRCATIASCWRRLGSLDQ